MSGGLRKAAGRPASLGMYEVVGSLDGVTPGRRVVRDLTVKRVGDGANEGLKPLDGFTALEDLALEQVDGVDLNPLANLQLRSLSLGPVHNVDLSPLGRLGHLEALTLFNLRDCLIPNVLALAPTLRALTVFNDAPGLTGAPVADLIRAVDWARLGELESLLLAVGGKEMLAPVEVDLGFLRHLPRLQRLDLHTGVWHAGPAPSPLDPPFERLASSLTFLRYSARQPEPLKVALKAYLGRPTGVAIYQRDSDAIVDDPPWSLTAPGDGVDFWTTYGSLADTLDGDYDVEAEAVEVAEQRLLSADGRRAETIEIDPEADGTGMSAACRADLEWALAVLGLAKP